MARLLADRLERLAVGAYVALVLPLPLSALALLLKEQYRPFICDWAVAIYDGALAFIALAGFCVLVAGIDTGSTKDFPLVMQNELWPLLVFATLRWIALNARRHRPLF